MTTLPLPPLVGTRNRARALTSTLPSDLGTSKVTVDGTNLLAATASFVDELIKQIVINRDAEHLTVVNVSDLEIAEWIHDRAEANGVGDRVTVQRD